ncbi:helix-turn-helix domain-containing protein [Marivirga salinae]|uniref:Helix-turn-helix domain-containing protein n=1 Tax=Marivirga salinarum TaxID=3059078 RepID=A0AA51RAN9_9BACT|nr:helix-turn-helix domain-containing protein [Marivirga sp. BDSF4-3]WMN11311.1 helix-turn-helix domain-containing protein [Marivirga sp. BDSF4-3]
MQRIKDFREQKGLTQSDLADKTGLSLRTIQRIESGQTIPKGHTLKVLSDVIGFSRIDFKSHSSQVTNEQNDQIRLINLSALALIVIPFGNIIFPFILWRKHHKDQIVNNAGKSILNFQIIWTLVLSLLLIISPFIQNSLQLSFSLIIVVLILGYCFNTLMIFKFSRWIRNGMLDRLKITYQLL